MGKHSKTIGEIIKAGIMAVGILAFSGSLDLFQNRKFISAFIAGAFGYCCVHTAIHHIKN